MSQIAHNTKHTTTETFVIHDDMLGLHVFTHETTAHGVLAESLPSLTPNTAKHLLAAEEADMNDISGEVRNMRMQGLKGGLLFSGFFTLAIIGSEGADTPVPETVTAVVVLGGLAYLGLGELRAQLYKPSAKKENERIQRRMTLLIKHTDPTFNEPAK